MLSNSRYNEQCKICSAVLCKHIKQTLKCLIYSGYVFSFYKHLATAFRHKNVWFANHFFLFLEQGDVIRQTPAIEMLSRYLNSVMI